MLDQIVKIPELLNRSEEELNATFNLLANQLMGVMDALQTIETLKRCSFSSREEAHSLCSTLCGTIRNGGFKLTEEVEAVVEDAANVCFKLDVVPEDMNDYKELATKDERHTFNNSDQIHFNPPSCVYRYK